MLARTVRSTKMKNILLCLHGITQKLIIDSIKTISTLKFNNNKSKIENSEKR